MSNIVTRQSITPIVNSRAVKPVTTTSTEEIVTINAKEEEVETPKEMNEFSVISVDKVEEETVEVDDKVMTEEDVHAVFEKVDEIDPDSKKVLEDAKAETEAMMEDAELEEMIIPAEQINPSDNSIKQAFEMYNLSDEEALQMMDMLKEYKETGDAKGMYDRLPIMMKSTVNNIIGSAPIKNIHAARKKTVEMLLDNFLQDARFNEVMDEYDTSMQTTIKEMNEQYDALYSDAINATFERIEEIRAENPEQAERIETVRDAYNNALEFTMEKEKLAHISAKKLNKLVGRFGSESFSFNKRVSNTPMKFPKIEDLYQSIRGNLPDDYSDDDIVKFLTLICISHYRVLNIDEDLAEVAYIHRLLSTLNTYTFTDPTLDDTGKKIFENIMGVIDQIKSL